MGFREDPGGRGTQAKGGLGAKRVSDKQLASDWGVRYSTSVSVRARWKLADLIMFSAYVYGAD